MAKEVGLKIVSPLPTQSVECSEPVPRGSAAGSGSELPMSDTTFTPSQLEAISTLDQPLQIIACAGSGKTEVISQRIAAILALPDVRPANVVAFTFTEKAAAELKDRVYGILEKQGRDLTGMAEMFIGTIHAYCLNLLQTWVPEAFKFSVLTEITQRLFIDRNSEKSGLTRCPTTLDKVPTLRRYRDSRLYSQVMSILSEDDVNHDLVPGAVEACWTAYRQLLGTEAYVDYSTMLELAVQLLERHEDETDGLAKELRRYVEDTVKYVVVDEYQDVNPIQERLVAALTEHGANLCVVGDDDQTIYQWRGSDVSGILGFTDRYQDVHNVTLAENFRSSEGIVALGRSIAEMIPSEQRLAKAMQHASHQQWQRGDMLSLKFDDPQAEAKWMADRLQAMLGVAFIDDPTSQPRGLSWSDMAVLFRSVAGDGGPLTEELDRRGIPYIVKGLTRLFDSEVIQAVVAMFAFVDGQIDQDGLESMIRDARLVADDVPLAPLVAVLDRVHHPTPRNRHTIYNIQRLYLDALEAMEVREDTIPGEPGRGALVMYQLGKFSQVISHYETIYFASAPQHKYHGFVTWLQRQAPDYYDEADAEVGYGTPDAVTISTVHAAKGMQWPVVFVPCLRANRFPAKRHGGVGVFHILPAEAINNPDRYRGNVEDEVRLLYVAVTRAKKYLFMSYSPVPGNRLYGKPSPFVHSLTACSYVSTSDSGAPGQDAKLSPQAKFDTPQVSLSFSELKYYFECPYQFKLRFLYGFNPPIHEALGYGTSLHNALAEIHKRAVAGEIVGPDMVEDLLDRHLSLPYAYPELRQQLRIAARAALQRYFRQHGAELAGTVHSEKQIQVRVGDGVVVDGRIDLITRVETGEVAIVDFKSTDRAQSEEITRDQLNVYAVGYTELTGQSADLIEILNLNADGANTREQIDQPLLETTRTRIHDAGTAIRDGDLPRLKSWCGTCATCDMATLCRKKPS